MYDHAQRRELQIMPEGDVSRRTARRREGRQHSAGDTQGRQDNTKLTSCYRRLCTYLINSGFPTELRMYQFPSLALRWLPCVSAMGVRAGNFGGCNASSVPYQAREECAGYLSLKPVQRRDKTECFPWWVGAEGSLLLKVNVA